LKIKHLPLNIATWLTSIFVLQGKALKEEESSKVFRFLRYMSDQASKDERKFLSSRLANNEKELKPDQKLLET